MREDSFSYALFTMQAGHRPISAFTEVFEHLVQSLASQFESIETESGSTRRQGLSIALSDMGILMTYSLVEGFFFEEHHFYFNDEPPRGQKLEKTIRKLFGHMGEKFDQSIDEAVAQLSVVRVARNAIAHRNGRLRKGEVVKLQEHFGTGMCMRRGYPVAEISTILEIIRSTSRLISRYCDVAVAYAATARSSEQVGN